MESSELKYAIVTGASSGIGAATAKILAKNGFHVIAGARRMDKLSELAAGNSNIDAVALDVTDQKSVDALATNLAGKPVSVLVNCAGGAFDADSILDSDPESWAKTYEVNVIGSVRMVKALAPLMKANGEGHIVVISSTAGHIAYENGGSYVAAKHGDTALARTLRLELNGEPIRSCSIPVSVVGKAKITTIEALSKNNTHPVQQAWIALDVPQCGYCQSGQIMAAAALLKRNPKPTDADIDNAMGNLCRCGTYQKIRDGIHVASGQKKLVDVLAQYSATPATRG